MAKVHLRVAGVFCPEQGQTSYEFNHQAACGYVRSEVATNYLDVTCFYCKRTKKYDELKHDEFENT